MQASVDQFGVLDQLIFNHTEPASAEPIARVLGLVHLYRASGVHLLAFFVFLDFLVSWLSRSLDLNPKAARFFGMIFIGATFFGIWKLQDYRLTLIRPIFTFLIRRYFKERGARAKIILPLILTFVFEFLLSTKTSLGTGAFHYYASVGGGLLAYSFSDENNQKLRHLNMAIGAWLPIAIFSLAKDHLVSYLTPFFSLVSLPVISFILYPFALVDIFLHGKISGFTISCWDQFLKLLFAVPNFGLTFFSVSSTAIWIACPCAVIFAYFWKKVPYPKLIFCIFSLGFGSIGRAEVAKFSPEREVIQMDVHQGDAAVMKQKDGPLEMVDVGSARTYAPELWLEKLSQYQIMSIDGILLSHLDEDHVGALKELLLLVPIGCIETSRLLWRSERGIKISGWIKEHAPQVKLSDSSCIHLSKVAWFESKKSSGNEIMGGIVFPISTHQAYFALGDGDESQEIQYEHYFETEFANYPHRIWKVSHHGSRFSSNLPFLKKLNPDEVWISVGRHNPYHHPNPQTLWRLSQLSAQVFRTDEKGDLIYRSE